MPDKLFTAEEHEEIRAGIGRQESPREVARRAATESRPWLGKVSRAVAGAPRWSPLRLLAPLRAAVLGEMTADDVMQVVRILEIADVRCWLAGGWGIDALLGTQTRRHNDLDVVIDNFDGQLAVACTALASLGLNAISTERMPVLMPDRCVLEDDAGHRVDLVSLDWPGLRSAVSAAEGEREMTLDAPIWTGLIGGRDVDCLSPVIQRVLRPIALRPTDHHDLRALKDGFRDDRRGMGKPVRAQPRKPRQPPTV